MPDDVLSTGAIPPAEVEKEPELRAFGDVTATRDSLFANVQRSLEEKFPMSNDRYTLRIAGTKYQKPKDFSNDDQKRALMRGQTLGWNLVGNWELVDNKTSKVVDKTSNRLIAQVPYITNRGTFIFNGTEYTVASQMRLRPGVYSRVKDNGIIEAHFNVKGGTGRSFRVYMEPETGVFRVNVGQANLKLYPLLRAMGIEDRSLNETWGPDLLQANVAASDPRAVQRAYTKMVSERADQIPEDERDTDTIKTAANKVPKSDVNYVMLGSLQSCSRCVNFEGANSCSRVQGFIADTGWCTLWNPTFGKYAQEEGNRRRARFVGEIVCDDSKPDNEWVYLKVHKGLPEAAFAALQDQDIDCEARFDLPHISVLRTWEVKQLKEKYGKKWKKICGEGLHIPFSLQNAMVDLDPEGWDEMDRVWYLEAKSPELRAYRKSLGFEDLPRGDSGDIFQFHITVAVKSKKKSRGNSKISSLFDDVEDHTKKAFEAIKSAIDEVIDDGLIKSAMAMKLAEIIDMSEPTEDINEEPAELIERQQTAIQDLRGNPAAEQMKVKQDINTLKKDMTTQERYFGLEELKAMLPMNILKTAYRLFVGREQFYDDQMTKQASEDKQYGAGLRSVFEAMQLDPNTTEMTLGKSVNNVSPELIVDVTKRLINISRREAETDDRDSLAFQRVYGPEDLFAERIARDAGGLSRKLLWKATSKGEVKNFPSGALSPQLRTVLLKSGLGAPLEEVNPLEIFDQQVRVTRMGEGGMASLDSVPDEARSVQPSHFGVIDPIRAPEGMKIGVDSRVTHRTYKSADGNIYVDMLDVKNGKPKRVSAETMSKSVVAFPGEMATKSKEVRAMIKGKKLAYVDRKEVDYELPHTSHMFTATSNMVPLVSAIKGGRLLMGAKMVTQALPLRNAESPLVQNLYDDGSGKSFEEIYGDRVGAVKADGKGVVTEITPNSLTVKYNDGRKKVHDLYSNFPFNRKSVSGSTIIYVRKADGQLWTGAIETYEHEVGDRTLTIDPSTCRSAWLPITGMTTHENDKRLVRVTLKSGRSFVITEDHSLMVMGVDGRLVPAYPDQCVVGDTRLPVAALPIEQPQDTITVDEALLAGLYLSEGHIPPTHPNLINIAVAPDARAMQVLDLFFRLGEKPYRNGGNVCVTSARLVELLRPFGHLSHGKAVPDAIINSSQAVREAVVSGYFGGDGCLNADINGAIQLYAFSVSRALRDTMSELLATFGIFTSFSERRNDELDDNWRRAYGLRVISQHIDKLPRWMFYDDREQYLRELLEARLPRSSPYEVVPVPRKAREQLYDELREVGGVPHFVYKTVCGGYVAKHRIARLSGIFGAWGKSDVCWDKVVAIEPSPHEHKVYDLSVETAEAFAIAGGVVVHNTYLHNTPMVKIGDQVTKDTLLAKSNVTDDKGAVALGLNLRVGYLPYRGYNADDAIVISESASKRLSSEHMYTTKYAQADNYETGKNAFLAIFPGTFNKLQMQTITPEGVVRPGTQVNQGDPLVLAIAKRKPTGGGMIHTRKNLYSDVAEIWDHESPGVVTDVDKTKDGWKVSVKAYSPMNVGDKLCYDDATEVLTLDGWKLFINLTLDDLVASLRPSGELEYVAPNKLYKFKHTGQMYKIATQQLDLLVTPNHRMYIRRRYSDSYELVEATSVFGKRVSYKKDARWTDGVKPKYKTLPAMRVRGGQGGVSYTWLPEKHIPIELYAALIGAYVSEGNVVWHPQSGSFGIDICQTKAKTRAELVELLSQHSIKWTPTGDKLRIYGKQLAAHFREVMGSSSYEKQLPEEVFGWTAELQRIVFDWLMWGDGHSKNGHPIVYTTTSIKLADDVQRLLLHIGYAGNIKTTPAGEVIAFGKRLWAHERYDVRIITTKLTPTVNHGHVHTQSAQTEQWVDYDGDVWCCELPCNHVLYVRRNGKPVWSGNSNRFGGKGVVSQILSDDKMPHDKDGSALELLLNPLGIVSRTNPAQLIEVVLGKVAKKTGHTYKLPGFSDENYIDLAKRELGKHGLNDTEDIFDPTSGRKIPKVLTGYTYMMKLHHMAEPKSSGRDIGSYTSEGIPAGGGSEGSKRIGMGEMTALISHGATEVIRDAKLVRGQRNDDFWRALRLGYTPPSPKVPMIYDKFISYLQGSGINLRKNGETTHLLAMTDKDTEKMSAGALTTADTVTGDKLDPVKGGLFDVGLTGGHGGTRWTHIELAEPMPNPVMEEPIRRLLSITKPQLMKIISGDEDINGETGPAAILSALKRVKVDSAIEQYSMQMGEQTGAKRDNAIKVLGYLRALKKNGQKPEDLMVTKVPVLPPNFRPITSFNKMTMISDPNYMYLDMMKINDDLKELRKEVGDGGVGEERVNLYKAYKAVTGLGDPVGVKSQDKQVRGMLAHVFGGSPKFGMYQRRVLGAAVDTVGRGVITPNPSLGMDQVGLPEDKAWVLFRPFVVRNLVRRGLGAMEAARHIENTSDVARKALLEEMGRRPVLINRAPVLHKYGMMASWAVPVKGNTLQVPPITTSGFNADFDGDAMNYHVPVSKAAVEEAVNKMMPSRNLLSTSDFDVHYFPRQEFLHGLHLASTAKKSGKPKVFMTKADVIKAYKRGELSVDDVVQMSNK